MTKQKEHGLFDRLIAEALNVPEEDVEQPLAIMRDNMQSNLEANETMREKDEIDQAFTDMMLKGGETPFTHQN